MFGRGEFSRGGTIAAVEDSHEGNLGVGRVSGRYDEWPLQGGIYQRENISHIFSWLCCSWDCKKMECNKYLSVPWCVTWGN